MSHRPNPASSDHSAPLCDIAEDPGQMWNLTFRLDVEDGWPPVGAECIPCERLDRGYKVLASPHFIKDLSVDDVIEVVEEDNDQVFSWRHLERSMRSTLWVMVLEKASVENEMRRLKLRHCRVSHLEAFDLYAIDIPPDLSEEEVDDCFSGSDPEKVVLAYPSWRCGADAAQPGVPADGSASAP
ncbi:MAG TPA: DUF4265 domain-containing protein [Burkholderiales bacterium]|nr:DUF4265 domain-containing protein [Burkholderiales bacterium]